MNSIIKEGDNVVIMRSFDSGNVKIITVKRETIIHFGKLHFNPEPLIGSTYGSVFKIENTMMEKLENFESYNEDLSVEVSNRIATFNEKSQFSQEKLIKKKKRLNYANIVNVLRPSLVLVNEMLYARDKIGGLRMDCLAQILTFSNIQNGSKCLLLDHNLGMMTTAVLSRILPDGICVQLLADHEAKETTRKTLKMLNIKEENYKDRLLAITVKDFYKVKIGSDTFDYENEIMRARGDDHLERLNNLPPRIVRDVNTNEKVSLNIDVEGLQQTITKKSANRESRNRERIKAASLLKSKSLDTIILIAQNDHPLQLLELCYEFLSPSRQFVIYCDTIQPLLDCHNYLKSNSLAVSLNVSESWLRRYQVLPDRTRPEMNMTGYGGYLLSGTKALFGPKSEDSGNVSA